MARNRPHAPMIRQASAGGQYTPDGERATARGSPPPPLSPRFQRCCPRSSTDPVLATSLEQGTRRPNPHRYVSTLTLDRLNHYEIDSREVPASPRREITGEHVVENFVFLGDTSTTPPRSTCRFGTLGLTSGRGPERARALRANFLIHDATCTPPTATQIHAIDEATQPDVPAPVRAWAPGNAQTSSPLRHAMFGKLNAQLDLSGDPFPEPAPHPAASTSCSASRNNIAGHALARVFARVHRPRRGTSHTAIDAHIYTGRRRRLDVSTTIHPRAKTQLYLNSATRAPEADDRAVELVKLDDSRFPEADTERSAMKTSRSRGTIRCLAILPAGRGLRWRDDAMDAAASLEGAHRAREAIPRRHSHMPLCAGRRGGGDHCDGRLDAEVDAPLPAPTPHIATRIGAQNEWGRG